MLNVTEGAEYMLSVPELLEGISMRGLSTMCLCLVPIDFHKEQSDLEAGQMISHFKVLVCTIMT